MITIINSEGKEGKLFGASKKDCTNDSIIINRIITDKFKSNWNGVFSHYIVIGNFTQCFLNKRFIIK